MSEPDQESRDLHEVFRRKKKVEDERYDKIQTPEDTILHPQAGTSSDGSELNAPRDAWVVDDTSSLNTTGNVETELVESSLKDEEDDHPKEVQVEKALHDPTKDTILHPQAGTSTDGSELNAPRDARVVDDTSSLNTTGIVEIELVESSLKDEEEDNPKEVQVEKALPDPTKDTILHPQAGTSSDGSELNAPRDARVVDDTSCINEELIRLNNALKQQERHTSSINEELIRLNNALDEQKRHYETMIDSLEREKDDMQDSKNRIRGEYVKLLSKNLPPSQSKLGVMMGSLVSITAFVVAYSNHKLKQLALHAFVNLCGTIISSVFDNIVCYISTDKDAQFFPALLRGVSSLPWVLMGGLLPLFVGGFIKDWLIRVCVTGGVTLIAMIIFAFLWSSIYKFPFRKAILVVGFGVVGIAIAACVPQLTQILVDWAMKLEWPRLVKKITKWHGAGGHIKMIL